MTAHLRQHLGSTASPPRHIVILALRRSGTTALWRLLRQDPQNRCFDEPLSPLLARLPRNNAKGTWDEFIALRDRDRHFWARRFAPVPRGEELKTSLTFRQTSYLRALAAAGPLVIDETRATGKLPAIRAALGPSVFVHLHRHPVAFASSHMIASQNLRFMRQHVHKTMFFRRSGFFNAWGMEDFWRPDMRRRTESELAAHGVIPPSPRAPAIHKLLAVWLTAYRRLECDGRRLSRGSFVSLAFEDFCARPREHLAAISAAAGRAPFAFDTTGMRPAAAGYKPDDPRWRAAAVAVGFNDCELARFFPNGAGR